MVVSSKRNWKIQIVSVGLAAILALTSVTAFAANAGASNGYQGEAALALSLKLGSADIPKDKEISSTQFVSLLEQAAELAGSDQSFASSATGNMTRKEAAQVITKGLELKAGAEPFNDVPDKADYAASVGAVNQSALMTGVSATLFFPNNKLTYEQACVLAY